MSRLKSHSLLSSSLSPRTSPTDPADLSVLGALSKLK